jgi:flagellar biogenesis protein FliO
MPSTIRITILIFLLALSGSVGAQTYSDAQMIQSQVEEFNQRPDWVKQCPGTSSGPVRIAPPLSASGTASAIPDLLPPVANKEGDLVRTAGESASIPESKISTVEKRQPIPLSPLDRKSRNVSSPSAQSGSQDAPKKPTGLPSMATLFGSLAVVVGVFLLIAWLMRRAAPQGLTRLPDEAFEVLGRAPLAGRQNVHLLRCGNKLLLVSVTPAGTETLTEITDPQEVDRLAGLCRQGGPHSSTAAFKQIFEQLAPKRPGRASFSPVDYADYDSAGIELSDAVGWEQRNG